MPGPSPIPRRSAPARLLRAWFGGPLLRIPAARGRDGRRLRLAVTASVVLHSALFVGGALMTAVGNLRGGGSMAGIEVVLDIRGVSPMPLGAGAVAQGGPVERAPEAEPAEALVAEPAPATADAAPEPEALPPEAAPEARPPAIAPTELAAAEPLPDIAPEPAAPEPPPDVAPAEPAGPERLLDVAPTALAALEPLPRLAPAPDAPMPDALETPRGADTEMLPRDAAPPALAPEAVAAAAPPPVLAPPTPLPEQAPPVLAPPATPAPLDPPVAAAESPAAPPPPPPTIADADVAAAPPAPLAAPLPATEADPLPAPPLLQPPPTLAAAAQALPDPAVPPDAQAEPPPPDIAPVAAVDTPPAAEAQPALAAPTLDAAAEPDPDPPLLTAPQLAAAEPELAEDAAASPIDRLLPWMLASLDTDPPPVLRAPSQSPQPDPEQSPTAAETAVPPALALPPDAAAPEAEAEPEPEDQRPVGPVAWTQPFVPPPVDPRRIDPATRARLAEALDAEISAILSEIECGGLRADADAGGNLSLRGYVTSEGEQAMIRDRLLGIAEVRGVDDAGVVVIGDGLCEGLAVYTSPEGATVAPDPPSMDHLPPELRRPPIFGMLQGAQEAFTEGRQLEIRVASPEFPAFVAIDYFKPDGTVVHLLPSEHNREPYFPDPETPITIANSEPGDISVLAGPPYGTGMVVTLATSVPLFTSLDDHPMEENAEAYLRRLEALLAERERDPAFRARYGYVFVDAVRAE